jgi:tetratricopeptide (TPR) repeat protein
VRRALAAARVGAPQALLVRGEPGIGKTRLAAEAGAEAIGFGAIVLYGRCELEPAEPHRAVAEALAGWVTREGPDPARERLGDAAGPLAQLAPALGDDPPSPDRHTLYAALASGLARVAGDDGLLLVLDDVHWADAATVEMVRHVLRSPARLPAVLLLLYRPNGPDAPHHALLEEAGGREGFEHITLDGLQDDEAAALAAHVAQRQRDARLDALAARLAGLTAGNPLYLTEITRHLLETSTFDAALESKTDDVLRDVPENLRGLVLRRIDALGPEATPILTAAALVGSEFTPATVRAATGGDEGAISAVVDAATRAGLLRPAAQAGPRFAFVHSVVERALAESAPDEDRPRLHGAIADALEHDATAAGDRIAALAHHRVAALPDRPGEAIAAVAAAGSQALERLAPHEARGHFETALGLVEQWAPDADALRDELRVGFGDAQRRLGEPTFRETLLEAGRSARDRGDDATLVRAVLANSRGFVSASGEVDRERVELLEAAHSVAANGADRARMLALLASERTFDGDAEGRRDVSREAVELARATGDPATTCAVLTLTFCPTSSPDSLDERRERMREAVALADQVGAPLAQFDALHWLGVAFIQGGRVAEAVRTVDREAALAERLGEPTALWLATHARAGLATMFGHIEQAEQLAGRALEHATASGQPDALAFYALQLAPIRFEQGRLGELQPLVAQAVQESPGLPALRALLALSLCEAELPAQAREVLATDAADGFAALPDDMARLVALTLYADVTARVLDVAAAETLVELLEPWADQIAYAGIGGWGPVRRAHGRVLAVTGRLDEAEAVLQAAVGSATRAGTQLWAARAQSDVAEVLLRRRGEGDRDQALQLLEAARDAGRRLGAGGIERRARMLADREQAIDELGRAGGRAPALVGLPRRGDEPPAPRRPSPDEARAGILRRHGALWHLSVNGSSATVRDGRGMRHLVRLLLAPGIEVSALELATEGAANGEDLRAVAGDDLSVRGTSERSEPLLDAEAKRAFRERVSELEEEREEAEAFNDPERAARAVEELDALREELTRSLGLGGRDRRTSSAAERARLSVTRAIRRTIARIGEQDPDLGRELDAAVRTGTLCSYRPAPGRAIEWRLDGG